MNASGRMVDLINDFTDHGLIMAMCHNALLKCFRNSDMAANTVQSVAHQYLGSLGLHLKNFPKGHVFVNRSL